MKITEKEKISVGCAATFCCHLDLVTVADDNIEEVVKLFDEYGYEVWDTMESALVEISSRWPDGSEEKKECLDAMAQLREVK